MDLKKIEPINRILENRFGLRIAKSSSMHLNETFDLYMGKRNLMLRTMGESSALQHPDYAKAVLISEGIRILLREIAPRRSKRKR